MILDVFDSQYNRISTISSYSFLEYTESLNGSGEFEIQLPLDNKALLIIQSGVWILFEKPVAGYITYFHPMIDDTTGNRSVTIKGKLLNSLLERRCIPNTITISSTTTQAVRDLVDANCVSPTDSKRTLPMILSSDSRYIPASDTTIIHTQKTGGSVKDAIEDLLEAQEMGYAVVPILSSTTITGFEFRVLKGADRTVGNTEGNSPVVFSSDLRNVLESSYTYNSNDYKNMTYVAGEGEGSERTIVEAGSTSAQGLNRYELYVDARDLSSTTESETLTPAEYAQVLVNRGLSKLGENAIEESYTASISDAVQYTYREDYNLGDLITVLDPALQLTLNARITHIQSSSLGEQSKTNITFGYYRMSTAQKLRRNGVI